MRNVMLFMSVLCCLAACAGGPALSVYSKPDAQFDLGSPITIMPAKIGNTNDLVLPDALSTELLGMGYNVLERTVVTQMVEEKGLDLTEILNGEEYFKLGSVVDVEALIIVNSRFLGAGVSDATIKFVDIETGSIWLSLTYTHPVV